MVDSDNIQIQIIYD